MGPNGKSLSNTQLAVQKLRELIFSGELAPGSDHLESELALMLGMSRTPIRDATLTLAAQGLLAVRPRKGVRISALSADDMQEIYEVLTEIECFAAGSAATKGYTEPDLAALEATVHDMDSALANGDRQAWALADETFHRELVRLGGNSRISAIVENFTDQVRRARTMTLNMRPMPHQSGADHRALYEAIKAGDARNARKIHRQHRDTARALMTSLLSQIGLKRV